MFCPPAVREKYTKKYGKKRVEEYERRMLARQQKQQQKQQAGTTTTEEKGNNKVPSISKFLRKRRSNKKNNSKVSNTKVPITTDKNTTTNITNNNTNSNNTRRWTTNDSKALLELGENGKTFVFEEDEDDDENHLDTEFGAYASGSDDDSGDDNDDDDDSTDSADEDNKSNDEDILYQDSSEDDDDSNDGNNTNNKSKRNLWSLPNEEALKQLERNFEMDVSNSSRRSEPVTPTSPKKDNNVFGIFVNAFHGMNFFHDKKNNNTKDVVNEDITAVSPEEQQKRANELLAALGMFGVTSPTDPKTTTYLPALPDLEVTETSAASDRITSSNNETEEIEEVKVSETQTQKSVDLSSPLSRFEEYYGGTYDDNDSAVDVDDDDGYDDDESTEEEEDESKDEFHDTHTTELISNDSDHLRQPPVSASSSKSPLGSVASAKKEKSILNMDIAVLAHTFEVSRNILNEDCEPSPSQKRMLISHFAQLRRKKTTKQQDRMRQKLNEDDDDEVMDLDDGDDDDDKHSDDSDDDSEEDDRKRKKEASTSGVDHVGADVFLTTQRQTRYYGTSAGSLTYGSHHKQRRSCRSVTSLSNIDEDSVVETCDGDSIPMVNRLMLNGPGTLWQDNHGVVVAATNRPANLIPDFKPRFEEDEDDVDSDDDDNDDDNNHQSTILIDDEDAKTAVSSSSSSRVSPVATPLKMQGIASPNDVSDRSLNGAFCFGGILLATPNHFTPTTTTSENGEINDSVSVMTENSRKSTSTTKKAKQLSSPLASLVHPMNRELFDIPAEDRRNNDNERTEIRAPKRPPVKLQTLKTPSPKKVVRNDDYQIGPKSPARTPQNELGTPTVSTPPSKKPDNISVLHSEQYTIVGKSPNSESRSRLSSSFRSSAMSPDGDNNRVTYSLGSGKKSMSKDERIRVQSLLPKRPVILPEDSTTILSASANTNVEESKQEDRTSPPKSPVFSLQESRKRLSLSGSSDHSTSSDLKQRIIARQQIMRTIAVLLIEPTMKLFEVVFLEDINLRETTVGDVLAKARANAVDPALSEQKYNSLCNEDQELAAPMLPVDYLLKNEEEDTTARPVENGAVLLVAVPVGYTAVEMQAIKTVLWKNPKTARWWDQKDPTRPTRQSKKKLDINEETKVGEESKEGEQETVLPQVIELDSTA